jgi:excisionase family DNA binding protein
MIQNEMLWTVADVAGHLGVCRRTVYRLAREGKLPVVRLCGKLRFRPEAVERAIRAHEVGAVGGNHRRTDT